jgi:hypothetical protein
MRWLKQENHPLNDFNVKHDRDLTISNVVYVVGTILTVSVAYIVDLSPVGIVIFTTIVLLLLHAIRIARIARTKLIILTRTQAVLTGLGLLFVLALIGFAGINALRIEVINENNFNRIFIPILLSSICSVWSDFFIIHLVAKARKSTGGEA